METRAIDVATALLVATSALCCAVVVGCAFLLATGAAAPSEHEWAAWCTAAALASASVATLSAITRAAGGLRPSALGVAWGLAFAWPLSGSLVPAALIATLGTGLAVVWGADGASGRDGARTAVWLAAAALGLMIPAFAAPDEGAAYRPPADARATIADAGASPAVIGATLPVIDRGRSPARTVRAYYRALDRRDFRRAWRSLSPAVRASFGGLERWSAGFAATLSSTPSELRVTTGGDDATVSHVLTARDRAACGVLVRRFSVHWRLRRMAEAWRAIALTAQPLPAPATCG